MESAARRWKNIFSESLEHDDWGHVIEAEEGYDRSAHIIVYLWCDHVIQASSDDMEL